MKKKKPSTKPKREPKVMEEIEVTPRQLKRRTFLAFGVFAGMYGIGYMGWKWLGMQPMDNGIKGGILTPLRKVLNGNEKVFTSVYDQGSLAKTYPLSKAVKKPRINGKVGIKTSIGDWSLNIKKANGDIMKITLEDIKQLPKKDIVIDFKCIEGWSQVTHWSGAILADVLKHYGLLQEVSMDYVGLSTPGNEYYVGIDMDSALHPQTLLCYEMNGQPLKQEHGAPLRLIIPIKYGVKNLKRIGNISFSNQRPPDYWAERGYDYYLGH